MSEFDEDDVVIEHARLADRSGYLRLTHRPSGLFVDAQLKSQPVLRTKQELMAVLRQRVLARLAQRDASEVGRPASPAGGRT
jgi:protein subunit release factor A